MRASISSSLCWKPTRAAERMSVSTVRAIKPSIAPSGCPAGRCKLVVAGGRGAPAFVRVADDTLGARCNSQN
jgi:hypothetical protein